MPTEHTNRYLLSTGHIVTVKVDVLGRVHATEQVIDEIMEVIGAVKDVEES